MAISHSGLSAILGLAFSRYWDWLKRHELKIGEREKREQWSHYTHYTHTLEESGTQINFRYTHNNSGVQTA